MVISQSRVVKAEQAVHMPGAECGCYISSVTRCHDVLDALWSRLTIRDFVVVLVLCYSVCYRRVAQRSHAASPVGEPLRCHFPSDPSHNFRGAFSSSHW